MAIGGDRVQKGRLLMAGLGEEIRGLWDTLSRVEAAPIPGGWISWLDHDHDDDRRAGLPLRAGDACPAALECEAEDFTQCPVFGQLVETLASPSGAKLPGSPDHRIEGES